MTGHRRLNEELAEFLRHREVHGAWERVTASEILRGQRVELLFQDEREPAPPKTKGPMSLIGCFGPMFEEMARVQVYGLEKRGESTWRAEPEWSHLDAGLRHLFAHLSGVDRDESGCRHLAHAMARLCMADWHARLRSEAEGFQADSLDRVECPWPPR